MVLAYTDLPEHNLYDADDCIACCIHHLGYLGYKTDPKVPVDAHETVSDVLLLLLPLHTQNTYEDDSSGDDLEEHSEEIGTDLRRMDPVNDLDSIHHLRDAVVMVEEEVNA